MNSTAIRLYVVVGIVAATLGVSHWLQIETEPPPVEMPDWTFRDLPIELDQWQGKNAKIDPKLAAAVGAEVIVDRLYHDELGRLVSMHTAMFKNPREGVYHSPLNCYRANGWTKLQETRPTVEISEDKTLAVSMTTWEKENERIIVVYWYQLGGHALYSRLDLGNLRWGALRGQTKWPVLTKVMLQTSVADSDNPEKLILNFTKSVAKWLNQPEHRKYLDQWPGV